MRTGLDADSRRGVVFLLLAIAAFMLVFAGVWIFETQLNNFLQTPGGWFKGGSGDLGDLALALVGTFIIIAANLLWLPGALIPPWIMVGGAAVCVLVAAYIGFGG